MNFDAMFPYDLSHPEGRRQIERAVQRAIDVDLPSKMDGECWFELSQECEKLFYLARRLSMAQKVEMMRTLCPPPGEREFR